MCAARTVFTVCFSGVVCYGDYYKQYVQLSVNSLRMDKIYFLVLSIEVWV
ncbi:hypothetical protein B0I21_10498 [Sphingobacterium paludis]|uniref:Uncharacterized protein n=1 Tax=Sphingobacterium paludis TaxID=1476465 RepID=A0A4R7D0M2_9SPHI|nr:hypothetical protein B0I21_10498 [Sphingobacterium paludis]